MLRHKFIQSGHAPSVVPPAPKPPPKPAANKREEAEERRAFAKSEQAANALPSKPAVVEEKKEEKGNNPLDLACDPSDYAPRISSYYDPPNPKLSTGQDLFDISCDIADAIDPLSPDPVFVGTELGWGELIDHAVNNFNQVPPNPYNPLFEIARSAIVAVKFIKDNVSTGYNVACQYIKKDGVYYDGVKKIGDQWSRLSVPQKTFVIGYIVVGVVTIVIPTIVQGYFCKLGQEGPRRTKMKCNGQCF